MFLDLKEYNAVAGMLAKTTKISLGCLVYSPALSFLSTISALHCLRGLILYVDGPTEELSSLAYEPDVREKQVWLVSC